MYKRNKSSILKDEQLKFLYEEILLYYESDRRSYGSASILDKKAKSDKRFKQFSFVYKDYESAMTNPQDDTFYFCAETKRKNQNGKKEARKVTYNDVIRNWFGHIRNAFAHNNIVLDGDSFVLRDYQEKRQTLYVTLTSFNLFEKLVAFVKEKINEEITIQKTKKMKTMMKTNSNWTKKSFMVLLMGLLSVMQSYAQGLETQSNTTGYIDCSHGVAIFTQEVRKTSSKRSYEYNFGAQTVKAIALYALNASGKPETLLWVRTPYYNHNSPDPSYDSDNWDKAYCEFSVLPGTKRIAKGAFIGCDNIVQLHIPSSIRYIPEDCFSGLNIHALIDISDSYTAISAPQKTSEMEIEEVARYNLQGQRIDDNVQGVQIVQYSDGSAKKILNR